MGDFIVIRCVHPLYNKEYRTNVVAVVSYVNFEVLLKIDVRGYTQYNTPAILENQLFLISHLTIQFLWLSLNIID
jgi:hypothetical protein